MTATERQKFLAERMTGLGGSDAAAIIGENPYKNAIQVWNEKMGMVEQEMNEAMRWGVAMEPLIRDRYRELLIDRTGGKQNVVESDRMIRHPDHAFLIAHVDGVVVSQNGGPPESKGILEVKTAGIHMRKHWGDEWTDAIPPHYLIQVQHYMGVTGFPFCHVAVLFGNREFVVYEVMRNDSLITDLFNLETTFWQDHVIKEIPPPIDGSKAAAAMLKEKYPTDTGEAITANDEVESWVSQLKSSTDSKKAIEGYILEAKNHIIDFMKENAILVGPDFKITYKQDKEKITIDYRAVVTELVAKAKSDPSIGPAVVSAIDQLIKANQITKQGARRFLPKWD